ncbi:MAG TPA: DnaJ domain-containing protein, partial [Casimicrobiaceae bacterium]|nr:DnaJ domain-containing protein [Casimicrobiaceae bacterium]
MKKTLYQILDVHPNASTEEIVSAHARLTSVQDTQWPDSNTPGLLQQAREILGDPHRRAAYDRSLVASKVIETSSVSAEPSFLEAWGKWIAGALVLGALTWWGTTRRETHP